MRSQVYWMPNPTPDLDHIFRPRRKAAGKAQLKRGKPVIENHDTSEYWKQNADKVQFMTGHNKSGPGRKIREAMNKGLQEGLLPKDAMFTFDTGNGDEIEAANA